MAYCLCPMAHGLWRMGYGLRDPDLPLSEHCEPILLPGGDRGLGCPPGVPGATHRDTWLAFGSPFRARHRGLGAHGSATPAAPASAVLWGRRRASSPSFSPIIVRRFFPLVGTVECVLQFASNAQHRGVLRIETVTMHIKIA